MNKPLFGLLFCVISGLAGCGGPPPMLHGHLEDRIDAEEHAYISLTAPIIEAYREHMPGMIVEATKVAKEQTEYYNVRVENGKVWIPSQNNYINGFGGKQYFDTSHLEELESLSPPKAFAQMHESLVKTVRGLREWRNIWESTHSGHKHYRPEIKSTFLGLYDSFKAGETFAANCRMIAENGDLLMQEFAKMPILTANRAPITQRSRIIKIEFQPKGIPLSFDMSDGVVKVACSFDVGVGSVTISQGEHPGIKRLVIIRDSKKKCFNVAGYQLSMPVAASHLTVQGETMTLDADAVSKLAGQSP